MRIALLSSAKSVHTIKWARSLSARGHIVELFSLPDQKASQGTLGGVNISYLRVGGAVGYWSCAHELKKKLCQFGPDILNAHYATGYGTLARMCGFHPLLLSVWGSDVYDFPEEGPLHRRLLERNLKACDAVASTSRAMARRVKNIMPGTKDIFITPFGVDTSVFTRVDRPAEGKITVGTVKALEPKYGIEYLIRGFSLFRNKLIKKKIVPENGVFLEIYGGGSLMSPLHKLADSLGLHGIVKFFGPVPNRNVPEILSRFDIFCAPSISNSESFGVAAVEAMACGVPVVAGNVDGFREVTEDGVTGYLVAPRDPVSIANRLFELAEDKRLRARMGKAGVVRVKENYEWNDCVTLMERALSLTVEKVSGRRPAIPHME